jgi:hypothetical protein
MRTKYYHIARTEKAQSLFDAHKIIVIPETVLNQSISDILSFHSTYHLPDGKGQMGMIEALCNDPEGIAKNTPDWPLLMRSILIKSNRRYTELIFETIRKEQFSHLPSRQHCIFLCEQTEVKHWYPAISDNLKTTPPIYEFEAKGKMHKADQRWLDLDILQHGNYLLAAQNYWSGNAFDSNARTTYEILFTGELTRTNKIKNLEAFDRQGM